MHPFLQPPLVEGNPKPLNDVRVMILETMNVHSLRLYRALHYAIKNLHLNQPPTPNTLLLHIYILLSIIYMYNRPASGYRTHELITRPLSLSRVLRHNCRNTRSPMHTDAGG